MLKDYFRRNNSGSGSQSINFFHGIGCLGAKTLRNFSSLRFHKNSSILTQYYLIFGKNETLIFWWILNFKDDVLVEKFLFFIFSLISFWASKFHVPKISITSSKSIWKTLCHPIKISLWYHKESFGIAAKVCLWYWVNLSELINFNPPEIIRQPVVFDAFRRNRS